MLHILIPQIIQKCVLLHFLRDQRDETSIQSLILKQQSRDQTITDSFDFSLSCSC